MENELSLEHVADMRGTPVYSSEGEKIGAVEEIFVDEETQKPEWIGLGTGFFGTKRVLVPVETAEIGGDAVTVPYSKEQVKDAPDIDSDELTQAREADLYSYYGLGYSEARSDTGLPEGAGTAEASTGQASVTRTEEELAVGKRSVEAGRVRIRKWVDTEPVSMDVELQRETAHVQRERIDQPVSDAEFGSDEIEVALRAEQPVVEKRAVAKERVTIGTDVETDVQTVSDEVRKERVEVEGDDVTRR